MKHSSRPLHRLQLPQALCHHDLDQAGWHPELHRVGVLHPTAYLHAQDEEPGVDQLHFCTKWQIPVSLGGGLQY